MAVKKFTKAEAVERDRARRRALLETDEERAAFDALVASAAGKTYAPAPPPEVKTTKQP